MFHCVEQGIVYPARHCNNFSFRRDFADARREPAFFRNNLQHAVRVNLVINLAQYAFYGPAHGNGVPRTKLPQVERALSRSRRARGLLRAQSEFLQGRLEILPGGNLLVVRQNDLLANALSFFLCQLQLAIVLIRSCQPLLEYKSKKGCPRKTLARKQNDEPPFHNSPRG